jgi:hypothetical protein
MITAAGCLRRPHGGEAEDMRGAIRRAGTAGLATAVLAVGLMGCTGDSGDDAQAEACTVGTYAWPTVTRTEKLTALADPIRFEQETDSYSAALKPVDDTVYRPMVTGAPEGVGAARVIKALGAHLKVEVPLAGPSDTVRPEDDHYFEVGTGDLKGDYYSWGEIALVEADFTYICEGKSSKGHVLTWETVGTGFLPCSSPADGEAGRTAARETCPADSAAVKQT